MANEQTSINTEKEPFWSEEDIISSYSRKQAIDNGILVGVSGMAQEAGVKYPVAVTCRVWSEVVTPDERSRPYGQSEEGRLWDVLTMFRFTAKAHGGSAMLFKVIVIQKERQRRTITLKALIGPGDDSEPVITIMFPEED